jgi:hypothetical protein
MGLRAGYLVRARARKKPRQTPGLKFAHGRRGEKGLTPRRALILTHRWRRSSRLASRRVAALVVGSVTSRVIVQGDRDAERDGEAHLGVVNDQARSRTPSRALTPRQRCSKIRLLRDPREQLSLVQCHNLAGE